jgi:hypothetical protein
VYDPARSDGMRQPRRPPVRVRRQVREVKPRRNVRPPFSDRGRSAHPVYDRHHRPPVLAGTGRDATRFPAEVEASSSLVAWSWNQACGFVAATSVNRAMCVARCDRCSAKLRPASAARGALEDGIDGRGQHVAVHLGDVRWRRRRATHRPHSRAQPGHQSPQIGPMPPAPTASSGLQVRFPS